MPLDICTISGTIYLADGSVAAGISIKILRVIKNGALISSGAVTVGPSDEDGSIEFDIARGSVATFNAPVVGLHVTQLPIPDSATANLEDLLPIAIPFESPTTVSQFREFVDDEVGALLPSSLFTYNDTAGTLPLATQTANKVFAGPVTGGDAAPTFRNIVAADIPSLSASYIPTSYLDADIALTANSDTKLATQKAVKSYTDNLVVGLLNDRGSYDASVNTFPAVGGSGASGAIRKGDIWFISIAGTLGGTVVNIGDSVRALVNAPAQISDNWSVLESNIGYVAENVASKATSLGVLNNTLYPTTQAVANALVSYQPLDSQLSSIAALADATGYLHNDGSGVIAWTAVPIPTFDSLSPMSALGDVIYGSTSGAGTRLVGNTTATRKFLRQTGNGAVSSAPAWDTLVAGDIPDISATYQLLNVKLTAFGSLANAAGYLHNNGSGVFAYQDIDLSGYVPTSRTVNGHVLSANVSITASDVGLGSVSNNAQLTIANNLSDLNNAGTARTNLGLGSLATQSGTFSGTSSGTNTGDQTPSSLGLVIGTNVQAWDADIDAIAAISATSGLLKKTAANTWSLDTAVYATQAYADALVVDLLDGRLPSGQIYVGNGSGIGTAVLPTGDVTFTNAGVTAIGTLKVTNTMLAGSIDLTAKVTGILPAANGGSGVNNSVTLNFGAGGTLGSNAFNSTTFVSSVSGTANQIDSTGISTPVVSLSSTLIFPGTFAANFNAIKWDNANLSIGLGSTVAPTMLVIGSTSSSSPRGPMSWQASDDTGSAHYHMRKSRGTFASPTTIVTGDILGRLVFSGYDGSNYLEMGSIRLTSTGTIAATRVPTKMEFLTGTDAAPSVATVALTLNADQTATHAKGVTISSGALTLAGSSSGTTTIQSPAAAGSAVVTMPNASSTLPIYGAQITYTGPSAARMVTYPDANFTVARTDAAQTFTGLQTFGAITQTGIYSNSQAGALSAAAVSIIGAPITGGTATTTFPLVYLNSGAAPTTFSTSGTLLGFNAPSGFGGNVLDFHLNGGASLFKINAAGQAVGASLGTTVPNFAVGNSTTYGLGFQPGLGNVFIDAGNARWGMSGDNHNYLSQTLLGWSASSSAISNTFDTTFSRSSAGVLQIGTTAANALGFLTLAKIGISSAPHASSLLYVPVAPTASANYGLVSLGSGAWDGSTSGFFVGSSSGTHLAINATSGFAGNVADFEVAGATKFRISSAGVLTLASADAGIARNAAGVIEVNSGTSGTLRDIISRDHTIDNVKAAAGLMTDVSGKIQAVVSDARLKHIQRTCLSSEYGLDAIEKLQPWFYTWKDGRIEGMQLGLIAQHVYSAIPFAARLTKAGTDEWWQIDQQAVMSVMVNAIKELRAEITNLKSQILG